MIECARCKRPGELVRDLAGERIDWQHCVAPTAAQSKWCPVCLALLGHGELKLPAPKKGDKPLAVRPQYKGWRR